MVHFQWEPLIINQSKNCKYQSLKVYQAGKRGLVIRQTRALEKVPDMYVCFCKDEGQQPQ